MSSLERRQFLASGLSAAVVLALGACADDEAGQETSPPRRRPSPQASFEDLTHPVELTGPTPIQFSQSRKVVDDGAYNAFAHAISLANGDLLMVYRKGSTHFAPGDRGRLMSRRSDDAGDTWGDEELVVADRQFDVREGCLTLLSDGRIALSYWLRVPGGPQLTRGVRVTFSRDGRLWDSPVTPDDRMGFSQCAAPVVEAGRDGDLFLPVYGGDGGQRQVRLLESADGGRSWTPRADITDGTVPSHEGNVIVLDNGVLMAVIRNAVTKGFDVAYSNDRGDRWTDPQPLFDSAQSAPRLTRLTDGRVALPYRDGNERISAQLRLGSADGHEWARDPEPLEDDRYRFVYGATVEVDPGRILIVYSLDHPRGGATVRVVEGSLG